MKQLEVQIMGQIYMLSAPESGEAAMRAAAAKVDQAMCRIRDMGKTKARDRIAVLVALNFAFEKEHETTQPKSSVSVDPTAAVEQISCETSEKILAKLNHALGQDGQLI